MARNKSTKANVEAINLLRISLGEVVDYQPIISYVMWACGASYREIGEVYDISPQAADYHVKQIKKAISLL